MNTIKEKIKDRLIPAANAARIWRTHSKFSKIDHKALVSDLGKDKKVLFHTIRSIPGNPLSYFEAILAHAMQARGAKPQMLFCGSYFNECDADHHFHENHKSFCDRCQTLRSSFIKALGIPALFYKDYITAEQEAEITNGVNALAPNEFDTYRFKDINVGYIARMSLVRYYQNWRYEESEEAIRRYRKNILRGALLTQIAENIHQQERPDIVLTLHGVYTAWEPFFKYFVKQGVTSYVYGVGMGDIGTMAFLKNVDVGGGFINEVWESMRDVEMLPHEEQEFETFLDNRFWKDRGWVSTLTSGHKHTDTDQEPLRKFLQRDCRKRFALFTNVPWDNALTPGESIFEDIFDWFDATVSFFLKHPEFDLIIKVHPAEKLDPKSYTFTKYIKEKFPNLPDNIFVIPNNSKVKAYALFDDIDLGLIYSGTLGLEMAIKGVPVLMGGQAHYTGCRGVVKPVPTREDYFHFLENPEILEEFHRENQRYAIRYGFAIFRRLEFPLEFFLKDNFAHFDFKSLDKLNFFVHDEPNVASICEQILQEKHVFRTI